MNFIQVKEIKTSKYVSLNVKAIKHYHIKENRSTRNLEITTMDGTEYIIFSNISAALKLISEA